jgi:hypothetical protein
MSVAHAILFLAAAYAVAGLAFTVAFVTVGVGRIDHAARGSPIGFRLIILPASVALWPVLLIKWVRS